ncbi:hypothetical protein [Corynebacterium coyleae]|nr:hypothetical protein [Corynebacterium coyleae]MDK8242132.1 hypothetical protein [Corynebacterium coyleae]
MTPHTTALRWAMTDLQDIGINPTTRLPLTQALTQLYASIIGGDA